MADANATGNDAAEPQDSLAAGAPGEAVGTDAPSLEELTAERDRFREMALRARADFDNYQKRAARDLNAERKYAALPLVLDLLPVVDNLDRALASARGKSEASGIVDGVDIVRKQLTVALEKHGVAAIIADGQPFDANEHQALMQQPTADVAPMTVLQTLQAGYKLHDRVIRPAQVVVAAAPPEDS